MSRFVLFALFTTEDLLARFVVEAFSLLSKPLTLDATVLTVLTAVVAALTMTLLGFLVVTDFAAVVAALTTLLTVFEKMDEALLLDAFEADVDVVFDGILSEAPE